MTPDRRISKTGIHMMCEILRQGITVFHACHVALEGLTISAEETRMHKKYPTTVRSSVPTRSVYNGSQHHKLKSFITPRTSASPQLRRPAEQHRHSQTRPWRSKALKGTALGPVIVDSFYKDEKGVLRIGASANKTCESTGGLFGGPRRRIR